MEKDTETKRPSKANITAVMEAADAAFDDGCGIEPEVVDAYRNWTSTGDGKANVPDRDRRQQAVEDLALESLRPLHVGVRVTRGVSHDKEGDIRPGYIVGLRLRAEVKRIGRLDRGGDDVSQCAVDVFVTDLNALLELCGRFKVLASSLVSILPWKKEKGPEVNTDG